MTRTYIPRRGYVGTVEHTEHELATGIYGLKELKRTWEPRKGYQFTSERYPEGIPRTLGRFTVGVPPSTASTARALTGASGRYAQTAARLIQSGVPAITAGSIIRDPRNVPKMNGGGNLLSPTVTSRSSGFVPLPSTSPSAATLGGGAIAPVSVGRLGGITGVTTGMATVGGSIMDTVKQYIPLIVIGGIAIIGIKMLMGK